MTLSSPPTISETVDTRPLVEPLGGPEGLSTYLDRFPEELYSHAVDSHLVRLLYTLVGPAGVGWLRQEYLRARLQFEERNLEAVDLDRFYASPFQFARIADEIHDEDPAGLIDREAWDRIRAQDARYRNRAMDFFAGGRLGNTPEGLHLVARSGLGHEVEIIENYRSLYDEHSDDRLGLDHFGKTRLAEEFIVLPRREISATEVQTITITGEPTGGFLSLVLDGRTTGDIARNALADVVQDALAALPNIGEGNVEVTGGPGPSLPWVVTFTGSLSGRAISELGVNNSLTGGTTPYVTVTTNQGGVDAADETVYIPDRDAHHLQMALDKIRPVHTIPTIGQAPGLRTRVPWRSVFAASEDAEVVRYVTGSVNIHWPPRDSVNWIELGIEHAAPRRSTMTTSYQGFHDVASIHAYVGEARDDPDYADAAIWDRFDLRSEHIGQFQAIQQALFPVLENPPEGQLTADRALADYAEPILVSDVIPGDSIRSLINESYPADYVTLPGVPALKYVDEQFWASLERTQGAECIEIDLGRVCAVNYLSFEVTRKPLSIDVDYDVAGLFPTRDFRPVTTSSPLEVHLSTDSQNPWQRVEVNFTDATGAVSLTRLLRLTLNRAEPSSFTDGVNELPWSVEIRNLRVGRNIT